MAERAEDPFPSGEEPLGGRLTAWNAEHRHSCQSQVIHWISPGIPFQVLRASIGDRIAILRELGE
jgi:hypothetical protein